jgi:hypothetical protein
MLDLLKWEPEIGVVNNELEKRSDQIITISKIEERLSLDPPLEARPRGVGMFEKRHGLCRVALA